MPDDQTAAATHYYEPANGHGLPHDPFNAIIGPRPIGWISSKGRDGSVIAGNFRAPGVIVRVYEQHAHGPTSLDERM